MSAPGPPAGRVAQPGLRMIRPGSGDALIVVDVQNDFVTGSLAVPGAAAVVRPLNRALARFAAQGLTVCTTQDWHPADHASFAAQGGPWPEHCVAGTAGAALVAGLVLPPTTAATFKGTRRDADAYSAFSGTSLADELRRRQVRRVFVGGLATDYCVLNTVRDAIASGFDVVVLADAIRAVDVRPGDGVRAASEMRELGASFATTDEVCAGGVG